MYFREIQYIILLSATIVLLPGCFQRSVRITSTAFADSNLRPDGFSKNKSFSIVNIEQKNELQTKELGQKISIILENKGYAVKNLKDADYCLIFYYGIKSDTQICNVAKYIPARTANSRGTYGYHGQCQQPFTSTTNLNGTYGYDCQCQQRNQSSGAFVYIPELHTFYTKFLSFYVYDANSWKKSLNDNNEMPLQIWQGVASSVDEFGDLRPYLDFLVIHLFDIFGKNTPESSIILHENNQSVMWLRHAYLHPHIESKAETNKT